MKIISKFKDYYDFVAGYDTDPRKVYIRMPEIVELLKWERQGNIKRHLLEVTKEIKGTLTINYYLSSGGVWFCDQFFEYIHSRKLGQYYYRFEDIPERIRSLYDYRDRRWRKKKYVPKEGLSNHLANVFDRDGRRTRWRKEVNYWQMELNTENNAPVIYSVLDEHGNSFRITNGSLEDIQFGKIKLPQEAFTELYNWIPYHEPKMPDDPTDLSRFESKGFDKKTSFRKM